jgi:hypothetical protein
MWNAANEALRTIKASSLWCIACKGLLVATIWLLLEPTHGLSQASSSLSNLLAPNNGGQVIVATSNNWLKTIDGNEDAKEFRWDEWAVFAFNICRADTRRGNERERIRVAGRK